MGRHSGRRGTGKPLGIGKWGKRRKRPRRRRERRRLERHYARFGGSVSNLTWFQAYRVQGKYGRELYRGRLPASNADFQALRSANVTKIVNLESGLRELVAHELNDEVWKGRQIGADVLHVRFSPLLPPRLRDLRLAVDILDCLLVGGDTFFHCKRGKERTGMVAAAWRIRMQGWSVKKAIAEMRSMGFSPWFSWWERQLYRFAMRYGRRSS